MEHPSEWPVTPRSSTDLAHACLHSVSTFLISVGSMNLNGRMHPDKRLNAIASAETLRKENLPRLSALLAEATPAIRTNAIQLVRLKSAGEQPIHFAGSTHATAHEAALYAADHIHAVLEALCDTIPSMSAEQARRAWEGMFADTDEKLRDGLSTAALGAYIDLEDGRLNQHAPPADGWAARLRQLDSLLIAAPHVPPGVPRSGPGMTLAEWERSKTFQEQIAAAINARNAIYVRLGDMLSEQATIARAAGVSDSALAEAAPMKRWTQAVADLTGIADPWAHSAYEDGHQKYAMLSATAVAKLLSAVERSRETSILNMATIRHHDETMIALVREINELAAKLIPNWQSFNLANLSKLTDFIAREYRIGPATATNELGNLTPGQVIGMLRASLDQRNAASVAGSWRKRPFDAPGTTNPGMPRDEAVVDAVRKVLEDWDSENWAAVRAVLENTGQSQERIVAMTLDDVRQYFAVGQRRITLALGGTPTTSTNMIVGSVDAGRGVRATRSDGLATATVSAPSMTKEAKAIAVLVDHPDWTDDKIAEAAGCNRSSLYRMKKYQQARKAQKSARVPRGSKSKSGEVEAWDDDE